MNNLGVIQRCRAIWVSLLSRLSLKKQAPHALTSGLFLRVLGAVYLIAFVSLGVQIIGLVGRDGILPAGDYLQILKQYTGLARFWLAPTLCWWMAGDGALRFLCWGGAALSILLIVDVMPVFVSFLLWLFYLSLSVVCRDFMSFQWDILLLEAGFLAIFLAPLRVLPRWPQGSGPELTVVWLLRWLLFRLIFGSGAVKLASGDPTWRDLTALTYHYQTQPLPTWIGWYAHQLPLWFQRFSVLVVFFMEILVPFLFLAPRRLRCAGCVLTIGFQLLIMATGNYGFFNFLTIALCILLLDDAAWPAWLQGWFSRKTQSLAPVKERHWPRWVIAPVAGLILLVSSVELIGALGFYGSWMRRVVDLAGALSPYRIVNSYGLFSVMTTSRPEIIVEGSNDQKTWLPYEFKYKPGNLSHHPRFVEPHQPRLDWQMWFAALGDYRQNPWLISFCARLLHGSPSALDLIAKNPFPQAPPRYLRALVYNYCFNDMAVRKSTGNWWSRELKGYYCPILSLRPGGGERSVQATTPPSHPEAASSGPSASEPSHP